MINNYPPETIGNRVINHNNNYGLDIAATLRSSLQKAPSLSVVIPYYEAENTINCALDYLIRIVAATQKLLYSWNWEIIVVDDGSEKYPAEKTIIKKLQTKIIIKQLPQNSGRSAARNEGLKLAKNEVIAFMDADIICPEKTIENHLKIHQRLKEINKNGITFSFFNNLKVKEWQTCTRKADLFTKSNDFRLECTYQKSWIGCDTDKQHIGINFQIMRQTNNLRNWPQNTFFGPWLLPNMVLGGFFMVDRHRALSVGGFSRIFSKYGFTETSLITKIIAKYGDFVLPSLAPILVHLHDGGVALSQEEKDLLFQRAHAIYFDRYLKQNLELTLKNEKL